MAISINTIIAAVDLEDDLSSAILKTAAELSELFHAMLHVVDVVTPIEGFETLHAMDATMHNVEAHQKAEAERLEQLTSLLQLLLVVLLVVIRHPHPLERLVHQRRLDLEQLRVRGLVVVELLVQLQLRLKAVYL